MGRLVAVSPFFLLALLTPSSASTQIVSQGWETYSTGPDRMTDAMLWISESPYVDVDGLSPPYNDIRAQLMFTCSTERQPGDVNSGQGQIVIYFTSDLRLSNYDGGLDTFSTRVRWDSQPPTSIEMSHLPGGGNVLFLADSELVLARILAHNRMLLELQWQGNELAYFGFPLAGATRAINDARNQCRRGLN